MTVSFCLRILLIVLNDVDEFCRSVGQANAEKQYELEKSKVDAEREEREAKVKKEKEIDLDVEEEYRKLKAQRMGVKFEVTSSIRWRKTKKII